MVRQLTRIFIIALFGFFTLTLSAQTDIMIEKATNGQDADLPPGPALIAGDPVTWTYAVTNTGSRDLVNIVVTDDQGVTVSCPSTTLSAGGSMICTGSGTVVLGQYANLGTAEGERPDSSIATDTDPSHYFGQAAVVITIEKSTNGEDADTAPGPIVPVGSAVSWEYVVTNVGTETLTNVVVTDDQGVTVTCPADTLAAGQSMTCTASGTAQIGQYANIGTAAATLPDTSTVVANDPSHYYGQTLALTKRTNGGEYAAPPGPLLDPGSVVTWSYEVTNPGPATVTNLSVTDDQGVIVTCPVTTLLAGESTTCTGTGTVLPGQYSNVGTATASLPLGGTVTASDTSFYFGNTLGLEKFTNGVDADTAPGPAVLIGSIVNWTYEVTNFGTDAMTNLVVTDDQGVTVTCPGTTLAAGESMTCTGSGIATAGQYANIGTAEAEVPGGPVQASDPSHYFGAVADYGDAPDPTYPTLLASNGARHLLGSGIYLGLCVDAEADGLPSAAADGDDTAGGTTFGTCATAGDDEDGVSFPGLVLIGLDADVDVVASGACTLSAWIDFNADGDWGDAGEDLFPGGTALSAGSNTLSFAVPSAASAGTALSRFRCTTDGAVAVTGQAGDGEVEDHTVLIEVPVATIAASKTDALQIDVDGDTLAEPGDTLRYTVMITNSGNVDATSVVFSDTPDANTTLVTGSVTTTSGTVTTGNTVGDGSVSVDVGSIAPFGGTATITFDVTVSDPLPVGVVSVSNQGIVSGGNFTDVPTDDPDAAGASDPTITFLTPPPAVTASKTASLATDVDADGQADPGDTLLYTIVVTNGGTGDALGVLFSDTPDPVTTLVAGSATTTAGTITTGNTAGDAAVTVDLGTLAGLGGAATISFEVAVTDGPLPVNVISASNQGVVTGSNFLDVPTDDPAVAGVSDPTVTPLGVAPVVTATKAAALAQDVDGDGFADGGDVIRYTIVVENTGSADAGAVGLSDTPDANTTIVPGSVTTTQGTIVAGNIAGEALVEVDLGTLAGAGGTATIVFDVRLNFPLPPGTTEIANTATISGSNFADAATDDPSQPGASDATTFPVSHAAANIPTVSEWMLLLMAALLAAAALWRMT